MRWSELGASFFVHVGGRDIQLPEPTDADGRRALSDAIGLIGQRIVTEEDAAVAIETFEWLRRAPLNCVCAHLCLAEVYSSGAAPQHGKDLNRAFKALVDFLRKGGQCHYQEDQAALFCEVDRISKELPTGRLSDHTQVLTSLAARVELLRGTALRACLAKLSCLEGGQTTAPADFLEFLLNELHALREGLAASQLELRAERERREILAAALDAEVSKQAPVEELRRENDALRLALSVEKERVAAANDVRLHNEVLLQQLEERGAVIATLYEKLQQQSHATYQAVSHLEQLRRGSRHVIDANAKHELPQLRRHRREVDSEAAGPDELSRTASNFLNDENLFGSREVNARGLPQHPKYHRPATSEEPPFRSVGERLVSPRWAAF